MSVSLRKVKVMQVQLRGGQRPRLSRMQDRLRHRRWRIFFGWTTGGSAEHRLSPVLQGGLLHLRSTWYAGHNDLLDIIPILVHSEQ